jgi:DNA replication protein DnaC
MSRNTRAPRGLDPGQLAQIIDLGWVREHLNVLITGPTGVGKSYLAAALAHSAGRADYSVRCFRLPRLIEELARYGAMQKRSALFKQLAKADLLEILDDRYDRRATLITSQLPIDQWHAYLCDRTVADAILDRRVHNSYRLVLKSESMRRHKTVNTKPATPSKSKGH